MLIRHRLAGFTLVELIVAIVIITVGIAGVLAAYNASVRGSGDAIVGKQLVAIAEEMMEEILLKPYDAAIPAAGGVVVCGDAGANRSAFATVAAYNGYQTNGICNIYGQPVPGLTDYRVTVTVQSMALNGVAATLRVTVAAARGGQTMVLDGFRTNY
jgi:MSHA pilin protein MshD